jgi:predicted dehydrogenase
MKTPKRYALIGTGGRSVTFIDALVGPFREDAQLVALCDQTAVRTRYYNQHIASEFSAAPIPTYLAADFDKMVRETRPDVLIVTTMDSTHHIYVIRAMELGCDVICEKPMTTDPAKAKAIFEAIERTGRSLRVTFNYRYAPHVTKIREVIRSGTIGKPLAVDFSWVLDTRHGADYFRRWHREKDKSGGLLVHKSTHHFDAINWWIDSRPKTVFAMGDLKFYGRQNAVDRGDGALTQYNRYTGQPASQQDPFRLSLDEDPNLKGLYLDAEPDTGYVRDRNVFGDNISVEDTMAVMVRYKSGVILNYSLICYSPWEGWRAAITGTKGRLEIYVKHGSHIIAGQSDEELAAEQAEGERCDITLFPMFSKPQPIPYETAEGSHGGGDRIMLAQLFSKNPPADPFDRAATHVDGLSSLLIGMSANASMASGLPIQCDDLFAIPEDK